MFLRKILIFALIASFSASVLAYGVYKALPIILGPEIVISSPLDGEVVHGTSISVRGSVHRAKTLHINSIPTAFTEDGNFETRLPVYPGSNILIIETSDRFGRTTKKTINIGAN
jgi:hypothetical protein